MGDPPVVQFSAFLSRLRRSTSLRCVPEAKSCLQVAIAILFLLSSPNNAIAQKSTGHHKSTYSTSAKRDSHGRIKRSESAKEKFMKQTGYPHGRPGYVIDHVVPLANGGRDDPSNMQWQTKADAKAKDKWERGQPARTSSKSSHTKSTHVKSYKPRKPATASSHTRSHSSYGLKRSTSSHYSTKHK